MLVHEKREPAGEIVRADLEPSISTPTLVKKGFPGHRQGASSGSLPLRRTTHWVKGATRPLALGL